MLKHIVLMRVKEDASEAAIQEMIAGLMTLPQAIPGVSNFTVGRNMSERDKRYTYALVCDMENEETLQTYLGHPVHVQVVKEKLNPVAPPENRVIVDYLY